MFSVVSGRVVRVLTDHPHFQELVVDVAGQSQRAYNYPLLYRRLEVGEPVRMNSAAVELGLGTGGRHFVLPEYPDTRTPDFPGHIMKLRYTPWQMPILAAEEENSPYHDQLVAENRLEGTPVVAASLHSMLPGIILGFRNKFPNKNPKIAYVMTDGAALPIALSNLVRDLKAKGLLSLTVTAGNAFGGDLEAVSLPSALLVAQQALAADLIVVALGPGIAGTGTKLGFSGIEQAWVIDLTARLGGIPIIAPRISSADPRPRHQGLSHHTLTVLELVSNPLFVPVSQRLTPKCQSLLQMAVAQHNLEEKGEWYLVDDPPAERLFAEQGLNVRSMGRGVGDDPDFFQGTVGAGYLAAVAAAGGLSYLKRLGSENKWIK